MAGNRARHGVATLRIEELRQLGFVVRFERGEDDDHPGHVHIYGDFSGPKRAELVAALGASDIVSPHMEHPTVSEGLKP